MCVHVLAYTVHVICNFLWWNKSNNLWRWWRRKRKKTTHFEIRSNIPHCNSAVWNTFVACIEVECKHHVPHVYLPRTIFVRCRGESVVSCRPPVAASDRWSLLFTPRPRCAAPLLFFSSTPLKRRRVRTATSAERLWCSFCPVISCSGTDGHHGLPTQACLSTPLGRCLDDQPGAGPSTRR